MDGSWRSGQLFACHCDCETDHPAAMVRCGGGAVTTGILGSFKDGPRITAAMCASCACACACAAPLTGHPRLACPRLADVTPCLPLWRAPPHQAIRREERLTSRV